MKKIYLVRHGKRESYHEDTLLSEIGVKQAEITGKYFKDKSIDEIYASPLPRTQQTAKIISEKLNLDINTDDKLKERLVWGDREGETFEEFLKLWDMSTLERDFKPEIGDSSKISGKRLERLIREIKDDRTYLFIAHAGIIGDFLMNHFPKELLPFQRDPYFSVLHVEILECSVTEVNFSGNEFDLIRVNDSSHLAVPLI
jgi:broad specificity phosphatase PhoE